MPIVSIPVSSDLAGLRLDQVIAHHFQDQGVARSRVQAWIKAGQATINGRVCFRPAQRVAHGESLRVDIPIKETKLIPEAGELGVVYQDEGIVVLNKPAGLVVHPAPGLSEGTMVHRLLRQFPALQALEGARPGIVHRLDKNTTGLLVVALNEAVRLKIAADFEARRVQKTYLALVYGLPAKPQAVIDAPIGRHPTLKTRMAVLAKGGRAALSEYKVLWAAPQERFSLLRVSIQTGRTHQIRVHLQHIGHPLLGDPAYSTADAHARLRILPWADKLLKRPMLHAWRLAFAHPQTGEPLRFVLLPPKDFWRVILACSRRMQRVGLTGLPGCGKSVLLAALAKAGLPTWSADASIRELYKPGQGGWELLHRRFGERFMHDETSTVDTFALLAAMRESPALRREIEAMMHPLAAHSLELFWQEHAGRQAAVAEVPLLLESGWQKAFHVLVGLYCPGDLRRQWLEASRGWNERLQADVESWQWSGQDKLRGSDLVVDNPGTMEGMTRRATALTRVLRWLRCQKTRELHHELLGIVSAKDTESGP